MRRLPCRWFRLSSPLPATLPAERAEARRLLGRGDNTLRFIETLDGKSDQTKEESTRQTTACRQNHSFHRADRLKPVESAANISGIRLTGRRSSGRVGALPQKGSSGRAACWPSSALPW